MRQTLEERYSQSGLEAEKRQQPMKRETQKVSKHSATTRELEVKLSA